MTGLERKVRRQNSNNPANPNKNRCALAVAEALGCDDETRYLHTIDDLVNCLRRSWTVRSRGSWVTENESVGRVRRWCKKLAGEVDGSAFFLVNTPEHVLLLAQDGQTLIDTAPRKRDRRPVWRFYIVYPKNRE